MHVAYSLSVCKYFIREWIALDSFIQWRGCILEDVCRVAVDQNIKYLRFETRHLFAVEDISCIFIL